MIKARFARISEDDRMADPMYEWTDENVLEVDGVQFVAGNANRFLSTVDRFCLVKQRKLVESYLGLFEQVGAARILELGIFQGGSAALMALLRRPELLIALDLTEERVAALDELIADRGLQDRVHAVYGVDQSDTAALAAVLDAHAGGSDTPFDLIIDDASHLVGPTRASFNFLFPRLRTGGSYIIEDWSWAHIGYGLHLPDEQPLTHLVFELTMALPSNPGLIDEIRIDRDWAVIVRGDAPLDPDDFDISKRYSERGRDLLAAPER
jgi:SAM-dependent methyltransferase